MKKLTTKIYKISLILFTAQFITLILPMTAKAYSSNEVNSSSVFMENIAAIDCSNRSAKVGQKNTATSENACKIIDLVNDGINLLSGIAGLSIVISIIYAGIQYSTAGANPQAASAAKGRINQALIALLALVLLYPFLQWIIPGGAF